MPQPTNKISRFWQELRRRKVIPIFIAYLATCYAIIEFLDITSNRFSIPDSTFNLLYILAAVGLPLAVILPWYIYRHKQESLSDKVTQIEEPAAKEEQKSRHNLPVQLTSFIGRKKEMSIVRQLINDHRLITLIGAGGCGKTRLACEVAAQLIEDYKNGLWFVDLSPITSGDLVAKEIMEVLKIQEVPNQPIVDILTEKIRDKNLLIILDNCEHLVKACAEITGKLIQSVTGLKILATSREALCIKGEHIWRVPSLTLIDPKTIVDVEHAKDSEAVLLFADRAQMNNPEFELETENVNDIVTICNKLDGIPLALELVASRTRHMNPQMILERFTDKFDKLSTSDPGTSKRQKTLQSTIEWSYNLLTESEKILFARLAVFSGGFDIEAAEEVCSDDQLPKDNVLNVLSRLVDRSLVYTVKSTDQKMRYKSLETLRQFALYKLKFQYEEQDIKNRHLHYYVKMAEQAYDEQFESRLNWLNRLEKDHDNIMVALNWAENHSPNNFISLSGTLFWFWRYNNHFVVGKKYLERATSMDAGISKEYARVLFGLGFIYIHLGDGPNAFNLMNEGLNMLRKFNAPQEEANTLSSLSAFQASAGYYEIAVKGAEKGLELARKIGKPGLVNHCLIMLCQVYVHSKNYDRGRPLSEELLVSAEKLENHFGIVAARHFLADCTLGIKDFKESEKNYGLGIKTALKYGEYFTAVGDIQGVAFSLSGQSRFAKSIRLSAAANEKARSLGFSLYGVAKFWDEWIETYIEGAKKEVGEELAKQYEVDGIAMGFEKAVEYALDFNKD